jgi:dihydrofolate synthase/folylpolyglutamate synthase
MADRALPARAIEDYLKRLTLLHPKAIDLSLDRIRRLLARLGHPERRLPPVLHVAGTNGKGSVVAYLRAMLEAAGYRTHVYTSPHLVRFNERIRLAGRLIEDDALLALFEECDRVNAGEPITFFEITTVAAFLAFARTPADALVLEVGLGGRLDTTNTVPGAAVTAITPVSLDHIGFLGDTVAKIAREKAGILKPGVPAVIAPQSEAALGSIREEADRVGAPLLVGGIDWQAAPEDRGLSLAFKGRTFDLPQPALPGSHQVVNAATAAVAAMTATGIDVPDTAIARGLQEVYWPARLQRLGPGPLVDRLPSGTPVWLDGAHNPAGGEALAATLADWQARNPRPLGLVVGMMQTKDAGAFLAHFAPLTPTLGTVAIPGEATSLPADRLAALAREAGLAATPAASVAAALEAIAKRGGTPRVVICGSIYLAGSVLVENGETVV